MMRRFFNLALIAVMIAGAAYTFNLKNQAVEARAELTQIENEIKFERETIELLKADWSLLTQPARLQTLTERYQDILKLQPIAVEQIVSVQELPAKPIDLSPYRDGRALGGYAGGDDTNIQ
ncbi:MAG: hypothetical protein AAGE89_11420 [Pseudomonadota bacterium]